MGEAMSNWLDTKSKIDPELTAKDFIDTHTSMRTWAVNAELMINGTDSNSYINNVTVTPEAENDAILAEIYEAFEIESEDIDDLLLIGDFYIERLVTDQHDSVLEYSFIIEEDDAFVNDSRHFSALRRKYMGSRVYSYPADYEDEWWDIICEDITEHFDDQNVVDKIYDTIKDSLEVIK